MLQEELTVPDSYIQGTSSQAGKCKTMASILRYLAGNSIEIEAVKHGITIKGKEH